MININHQSLDSPIMSSPMQLAQDHLDLAHVCLLAAEQALTTSRANVKVLSLEHARTGSGAIYNQMQSAKRQNTLYFMAHRTSESAYAAALESFHLEQSALE